MKKMLSLVGLLAVSAAVVAGPPQGPLKRSLEAYWQHEEIGPGFRDEVKDRFNLQDFGGVTDTLGVVGNASALDGTPAGILQASRTVIPNGSDFTVSGWFRPIATPAASQVVFAECFASQPITTCRARLFYTPDLVRVFFQMSDGSSVASALLNGTLTLGEWYFYAARYNMTTGDLLLTVRDQTGVPIGPDASAVLPGPMSLSPFNFTLGATSDLFGTFGPLDVDETAVNDEWLPDATIDQLGAGVTYPTF